MKKKLLFIIIIAVFSLSLTGCGYNKMVTYDEMVHENWSQVQNQYQRRLDLIPNLVETVKGYTDYEGETLVAVMEARARATSITVDPSDPVSMQEYRDAQEEVGSALSRLLVSVEAYPELKASGLYSDLMHQLEGTENRIAVARMDYNAAVRRNNALVRSIPQMLYAEKYGFTTYEYLEFDENVSDVPVVDFGDEE